nr:hypothetical protein [Nostoc sp. EkiNYC01]
MKKLETFTTLTGITFMCISYPILTYEELCRTNPSHKFVVIGSSRYDRMEVNWRYEFVAGHKTLEGYNVAEYKRHTPTRDSILSDLHIAYCFGTPGKIHSYSETELIFYTEVKMPFGVVLSAFHIREVEYFVKRDGFGAMPNDVVKWLKRHKHLPDSYQIEYDDVACPRMKTIE